MKVGFYDSVKDDVREDGESEGGSNEQESGSRGSSQFDTLKREAESFEGNEGGSSDTEIEILQDGEFVSESRRSRDEGEERDEEERETREQEGSREPEPEPDPEQTRLEEDVSLDQVVQTLKSIERQNEDIVNVLRGIKRTLDN